MKKRTEWTRLQRQYCNLCYYEAIWKHPAGGFRCGLCPRQETTKHEAKKEPATMNEP